MCFAIAPYPLVSTCDDTIHTIPYYFITTYTINTLHLGVWSMVIWGGILLFWIYWYYEEIERCHELPKRRSRLGTYADITHMETSVKNFNDCNWSECRWSDLDDGRCRFLLSMALWIVFESRRCRHSPDLKESACHSSSCLVRNTLIHSAILLPNCLFKWGFRLLQHTPCWCTADFKSRPMRDLSHRPWAIMQTMLCSNRCATHLAWGRLF